MRNVLDWYQFLDRLMKSDLNNDNKENTYVKVYTMSYPFIKQGCRFTMEDWTIDVYLA